MACVGDESTKPCSAMSVYPGIQVKVNRVDCELRVWRVIWMRLEIE